MSESQPESYSSPLRHFAPGVPIHITNRYSFRADLAKHRAFKELATGLMVAHSKKCQVTLHTTAVMDNHIHAVVSEGRIPPHLWRILGVSPWLRNWQSDLSLAMNLMGLDGIKFRGRFKSTNLDTLEKYLVKYAYVMGQALRHRADRDDVLISDEMLTGELDGIVDRLPALFAEEERVQQAEKFGALVMRILDHVRTLAEGGELRLNREARAARRRRRQQLEGRRESRQEHDRRERERRDLAPADWWEATQVAMWNHALDPHLESKDVRWISAASIAPRCWARARAKVLSWRKFPTIDVTHLRERKTRRVHTTIVSAQGQTVRIRWTLRMQLAGLAPP
jgi:REP element-mobilizing transposase RayT